MPETLREDVELISGVYGELNIDDYLSGTTAPCFLAVPLIISG
jgi:peptide chain release factor 3